MMVKEGDADGILQNCGSAYQFPSYLTVMMHDLPDMIDLEAQHDMSPDEIAAGLQVRPRTEALESFMTYMQPFMDASGEARLYVKVIKEAIHQFTGSGYELGKINTKKLMAAYKYLTGNIKCRTSNKI